MADEMDFYSSDYHNDDAFETPSKPPTSTSGRPKGSGAQGGGGMRFDTEEAREAALRKELEGVRKINEVIEGMIGTLERAKGNMGVCTFPTHSISGMHLSIRKSTGLTLMCHVRPSPKPSPTPQPCSTPGRACSRRPSTTSA